MNRLNKLATALLAVGLVGASLSGAAFAHDGKGGKGKGGFGGPGMMMEHGGKDGHRGGKGGHGMMGGVHQTKYMTLLVKAYAPTTQSDWDTYLKAEKELITQEQALMDSLRATKKRLKPAAPDQATLDAHKAAHEALRTAQKALTDALIADKDADITAALQSLLTANKQMLVIRAQQFEALKKAAAAASATTPAPSTSSFKNSALKGSLQAL